MRTWLYHECEFELVVFLLYASAFLLWNAANNKLVQMQDLSTLRSEWKK